MPTTSRSTASVRSSGRGRGCASTRSGDARARMGCARPRGGGRVERLAAAARARDARRRSRAAVPGRSLGAGRPRPAPLDPGLGRARARHRAGGALPGEHPLPRARRARLLGAPARPRARGGARLPRERERRPHLQRDGPDHGARHGSRHLRARPALDGGRAGRIPRRGGVHLLAHEHPRLGSPARDRGAPLPARAAARLARGGRAAAGLLGALGARRVPWHLRAGLCLVAVVGFALALGPAAPLVPGTDLPGLYALAARVVPGFAGMRAPIRFLVLPLLSLAVLAGMGAAAITGGRRWARVLPLAAAALVIHADARPVPLAPVLLEGSDVAAYRWLAEHGEHGPTLELPVFLSAMDGEQLLATGRYMVASTLHWNPLLNGYTGYTPPSYPLLATLAQRLPDPTALADLCALVALRWLVVHQAGLPPAERAAWEGGGAGLARAATFGDDVIYRVDRGCGGLEPALRRQLVGPDPGPDGPTLPGVSRAPPADLRGELRPRLPHAVVSGLHGWFAVTVSNTGSAPWPGLTARARGRVVLQARWRGGAGAVALAGEPGLLARDLAPGESVETRVGSMTPRPGSYTLEIGLLQDGVGWFAEQPGGTGLVTATVRARPWEEVYPPKR